MLRTINQEVLVTIFEKGIANNEFFCRKEEGFRLLKNWLKIARLFLYRLSCGTEKRLNQTTLLLVWFPLHEKILSQHDGEEVVLLAKNNTLNGLSFLSYISFFKLFLLLLYTPVSIYRRGLNYDWIFYRALLFFLEDNKVDTLIIAGHYDKYATWISYLAKEKGIYLTISQHGANSRHNLPYKIPANRVEVFSKAEEEMFKSTTLNPNETEFYIKGFQSTLTFKQGGFKDRTVAIASQPGYEERVIKLIEIINDIDNGINIMVYSHPTDNFRNGCLTLGNRNKCRLEHQDRYWDVDYLVVFTSTLAYDYWSCEKFTGKVLCCYDERCIVALYDDERGTVIYPETCYQQLKDIFA